MSDNHTEQNSGFQVFRNIFGRFAGNQSSRPSQPDFHAMTPEIDNHQDAIEANSKVDFAATDVYIKVGR